MMQERIAEGEQCADQPNPALRLALARVSILYNFYQAERRAGASPLIANERMHEFAKRLDSNNQAT